METTWKDKTKREYIIELINKIKITEPTEVIEVPEKLKGFGTIIHDNEKCISCGACTRMCEDVAIFFDKVFDLNGLNKLPTNHDIKNRKILAEFIEKLKVKEPVNPISVPEGLLGFGTIELNLGRCIFCEECFKVCQFEAITKEKTWNLPKIIELYNAK